MQSAQTIIKQKKSRYSKENLHRLCENNQLDMIMQETCKTLLMVAITCLMLMLLNGCGTTPVVTACPQVALPQQYKHDLGKLPSAEQILNGSLESGDDLSLLLLESIGTYNQCRIGYNSLWRECDRLIETKEIK